MQALANFPQFSDEVTDRGIKALQGSLHADIPGRTTTTSISFLKKYALALQVDKEQEDGDKAFMFLKYKIFKNISEYGNGTIKKPTSILVLEIQICQEKKCKYSFGYRHVDRVIIELGFLGFMVTTDGVDRQCPYD